MINASIQWANRILENKGYRMLHEIPEEVLVTPWSEVWRFVTDSGFVYLKKVPMALSLEAKVIKVLHSQFSAPVPQIIAENAELHCFLMSDAGIRLYDFFNKRFQPELLVQAMQDYTDMQMMAADSIDVFFNLGVPDWRLEQLPKLYRELIRKDDLLIHDGLTESELKKLEKLDIKLLDLCDQLSNFAIPETLGHCDFHDKNILVNVDTNQTTIIDLGEVAITHPFFSLHNCLYRAKENFSLSENQYQNLQETCFKHWLAIETKERLFEILAIIQQCWSIHSVLGEYRLMQSVPQETFHLLQRQGRLANNLRYWCAHEI
jgi:aminoglycoside/choline kinase family phosphotransferase